MNEDLKPCVLCSKAKHWTTKEGYYTVGCDCGRGTTSRSYGFCIALWNHHARNRNDALARAYWKAVHTDCGPLAEWVRCA